MTVPSPSSMLRRLKGVYLPLIFKSPFVVKAEPLCYRIYPEFVSEDDVVVEIGALYGGGTLLLSKLAKRVLLF